MGAAWTKLTQRDRWPALRWGKAAGLSYGGRRTRHEDEGAGGALQLRPYVALWLALGAVSAAIVLRPDLPVAWSDAVLAVALSTMAGVVGLAVLEFGILRFTVFGRPLDLLAGLAFGVLAADGLVVRVAWPAAGRSVPPLEVSLYLMLYARAIAALLFLAGLAGGRRMFASAARANVAWRLVGGVAALLLLGDVAILSLGHLLPDAVNARAIALLQSGAPIADELPGQRPGLIFADGLIALLMLVDALGYIWLARRTGDTHVGWTAAALSLLFFSQVHSLLFPPIAIAYVSTADAFRLGAYTVLLFSLLRRVRREIAERASGEERLRLSRELHDGLAQQLSLLHLRLNRARTSGRAEQERARDLELAARLVESALLEARQVITALRTGAVTWEELTRTLSTFAEEFGQNHGVDVRLDASCEAAADALPPIHAAVGAELLRLLHEALSNAVRHGHATTIDVTLAASRAGLTLRVHDNGAGFDPLLADRQGETLGCSGLGLRSMRERVASYGGWLTLEAEATRGTVVEAWLPFERLPLPSGKPMPMNLLPGAAPSAARAARRT